MAFIKCIDCGKIYDTSLEACPQCGCPTEQQQIPPVFNSDDNVPVDATSIFNIKEDKFEETKDIRIATRGKLSTSVDDLCKSLQAQSPQVHLTYHMEKGVGQLLVCYDEKDFLKKIDSNHNKALANKYSCACKRLIINIDDKENIRLDLENNESKWKSDFPISQEMFLKCCRAKKLEFKISKENEESILVNGYYGFDPESGAEIDANGNIVPENELILNFQTLYNYVIDQNFFKDALQRLNGWNKKKKIEIEEEVKRDLIEKKQNKKKGLIWLLTGILSFIVGAFFLMLGLAIRWDSPAGGVLLVIVGVCMFVMGLIIAGYGGTRMKGLSSSDALKEQFVLVQRKREDTKKNKELKNNSTKKTRFAITIAAIILFLTTTIVLSYFDVNLNGKKYQINNTQDWVDFVSSASGAKEIDKGFMSMSPRQIVNIYEEMVPAIVHITTLEFDAKSKCRAFMWLYCGIIGHSDRFTQEQYSQIKDLDYNEKMAWTLCFTCLGSEADEIAKEYGHYCNGK